MNNALNQSILMGLLLAASACAAYEPEPLHPGHPAHIGAAEAPAAPRSRTLVYTAADVPSARPAASAASEPKRTGPEAAKTVSAEGKVVAAVPSVSQIVVEHGEIKGFMEAMTMGYRVEPPSLLEGLKFGDKVLFTIDLPTKAIVKIEKLK